MPLESTPGESRTITRIFAMRDRRNREHDVKGPKAILCVTKSVIEIVQLRDRQSARRRQVDSWCETANGGFHSSWNGIQHGRRTRGENDRVAIGAPEPPPRIDAVRLQSAATIRVPETLRACTAANPKSCYRGPNRPVAPSVFRLLALVFIGSCTRVSWPFAAMMATCFTLAKPQLGNQNVGVGPGSRRVKRRPGNSGWIRCLITNRQREKH